jgi:hypothetical protein
VAEFHYIHNFFGNILQVLIFEQPTDINCKLKMQKVENSINIGLDINLKRIFRLPEHQQNCYWRGWGVTLSLIFVLILTLGAPLHSSGKAILFLHPNALLGFEPGSSVLSATSDNSFTLATRATRCFC